MDNSLFNYHLIDTNFKKYLQVHNFLKRNIYHDILKNISTLFCEGKVLNDKYSSYDEKFKLKLNNTSERFHESINLFIEEINSNNFHSFIERCFNSKNFKLNTKLWISLPESNVEPHYDDSNKIGNIMFYLNETAKGGETVFWEKDNPVFTTDITDNTTVFMRTENNKHSVNENFLVRKVIIVNVWK
tara:strand:+ start:765 stop:1325 length:561 start_codon:yes stop_codon:yes gene_type:complete